MEVLYNNSHIRFEKVAPNYSENVFSEFIKNMIFRNHLSYDIIPFAKNLQPVKNPITRSNFESLITRLFGCDVAEIQFSAEQYKGVCYPRMGLYYNQHDKTKYHYRYIAIVRSAYGIKLTNVAGEVEAVLKAK